MDGQTTQDTKRESWPDPPGRRHVVLHTRVVTESGGGPDKTILLSPSYMNDTPYWLAAAYMHPPDDPGFARLSRRAVEMSCPLVSIPDRGPLDRSVFRRMLDLCRHYRVRVWHGHDYKSNMLGLALRPFCDFKLISTVHGWVKRTMRTPLYYAVDRWCLPYYHHVICVSQELQSSVMQLGVPDERLSLIHNAIDERRYRRRCAPADAPRRRQRQVPPGRFVIGSVGRLSPEKAFHHLILAVQALVRQGLDVELWIAGDGDSRPDLERLVTHLGLEQRVKLFGFVDETIDLYQAMDLFVLTSLREGLPNVLLEAMSMSVPVVATRVAGVPELVRDGCSGLLCEPGEVRQIAEACQRVLADEHLRRRLGASGRSVIEKHYSFALRMAQVRKVYDRVLETEAPSSTSGPPHSVGA